MPHKARDFTLDKYLTLCEAVLAAGYAPATMAEFILAPPTGKAVAFRHDVDRCRRAARDMAEAEARIGLRSTYYFRMTRASFDPDTVRRVAALGHEVGYHYETMVKCGGESPKAIALFEKELAVMRSVTDVKTISMHGSPLSQHDNLSLWKCHDYRKFGILGDASLDVDYQSILYFSDTGRTWNGTDRRKIRDRGAVDHDSRSHPSSTDELMTFLASNVRPVILQAHPERWRKGIAGQAVSWLWDQASNAAKQLLAKKL